MGALEQLNKIIEDAKRVAKTESLSREHQRADQNMSDAQKRFDEAGQKRAAAKRDLGNLEQKHQAHIEKLATLKTEANQFADHINSETAIDSLIKDAEYEIETEFCKGTALLCSLDEEVKSARTNLDRAREQLREAKAQLEKHEVVPPSPLGAQVHDIESPGQIIAALKEEVENSKNELSGWPAKEQQAMLCVWAGRARLLQDTCGLNEQEQRAISCVFGALSQLSKCFMPGFVKALKHSNVTDWPKYIEENRQNYNAAVKARKAAETQVEERRQRQIQEHVRQEVARSNAKDYLDRLTEWCRGEPDAATCAKIKDIARVLIDDVNLEPSDPCLVAILHPYREIFKEGATFRALRRAFERFEQDQKPDDIQRMYPSVVALLAGKRVSMVGGSPREERRQAIEKAFGLKTLTWASCQGKEPRVLEQLGERIKNSGVDIVLELTSLVGHQVEQLKPVCDDRGIPFIRVPQGYGVHAIAQAVAKSCSAGMQ